MSENKTIPVGLKYTFLVHFIIGIIYGLFLIFAPDTYAEMFEFVDYTPMTLRMIGGAILAFGISSWFAYKATSFEIVKIIMIAEIAWTALAAIINIWGIIADEFPAWAWLNAIMMLAFTGAFGYFFFTNKE